MSIPILIALVALSASACAKFGWLTAVIIVSAVWLLMPFGTKR